MSNPLDHYGKIGQNVAGGGYRPGGGHGGGGGGGGRAAAGGGEGNRNYSKPWLVPENENKKKDKASTFAEHCYPDGGIGPESDLINMIEKDLLQKNPNV
jgi:hypothetical protein